VILLGVVGLGWFVWTKTHPADNGLGPILTGTVKKGDLVETVTATGSVAAQTGAEVHIGSQITGRIKRLYADVGQVVKKGDLIAELDLPEYQAELQQSNDAYQSSISKLTQAQQNYTLGLSQTSSAVAVARASLRSSMELLKVAQANADQQKVQTPADIQKAEAALQQAVATLSTATSNLNQVQAGANLTIQNAEEALTQAQATDKNNQTEYAREPSLGQRGFVPQSAVDAAKQAAEVSSSQVRASTKSLEFTKQSVTANLQAARDQVVQAQQGVASARSALQAARAETYTTASKIASVADAQAAVAQARANLTLAVGNLTSNAVHQQDIKQADAAMQQASKQIVVTRSALDKTFIRAPISGTVLNLAVQQGETLAAGLSAPTVIVVADLNRLEVDAYIDETDIGKVKVGQPVQVVVDAFPNRPLKGKITKVSSGSDSARDRDL
jgi:multidrug resistance efflux pump